MPSIDLITPARAYLGQREVPGPASNGWIKDLWLKLRGGAWFWKTFGEDDSKLPWCGAFLARVCQDCGLDYPDKYAQAAAWASWGQALPGPMQGAVAVLTRSGGGHVGIVTGVSADARYVRLLGGNQGDAVCEAWFQTTRVSAWRRPANAALQTAAVVPVGAMSTSEA